MQRLQPKIGLATIVSSYEVGGEKVEALQRQAARALADAGMQIVVGKEIVDSDENGIDVGREISSQDPDAICILYGTYADDTFATTVLEQCNIPAIVWGTNDFDTGSIAGAQQVSEVLTETGRYYKLVFGNIDDRRAIDEVAMTARAASARKWFVNSRVGVIGYPRIKGQTQAAFDELELHEKFGCRIVGIGTHRFVTLKDQVLEEEARQLWLKASNGIRKSSVSDEQIVESARAYLAMKKLVLDYKLDAVAFEDWFEFIGLPNLAFSLLNDEGVPAACEADVHSALTMCLLALLTGKPSFHGELLGILEDKDALLVAHYGAGAPSLAKSKEEIRFEADRSPRGRGVSIVYEIEHGPVTVASLTGRRGSYRMLIAPGESIPAREVFHGGIFANVRFRANHREVLQKAKGMSHHWLLGIGDVSGELVEYCEMSGIKPVVV